jgi:cell division protein FtsB
VGASALNRKIVTPKVNKKAIVVVAAALILISITIGTILNQYWRIASLDRTNDELSEKLENTTQELESLQKNYADLQNGLGVYVNPDWKPPIETRLGIKLMDNGQRFGKYYLWVTGEAQNTGNHTAYNVTLIFKLHTDNGTQVKPQILGTLKPYETISTRLTIWSDIGTITSWELETAATYQP